MTEGMQQSDEIVIHSVAYGQLRIDTNRLYRFERGILGVQHIKEYALFPIEDSPFNVLHAVHEQVSFILVPAVEVVDDYGFEINQELVDLLELKSAEDAVVFLMVNMQEQSLYVNLRAPILISPTSYSGCQHVITDKDYPIRYLLTKKEGTHAGS